MERNRLNKSPVGKLLTFTEDVGYYDCENFILNTACEKYNGFSNWIAHLNYVNIIFSGYKNIYSAGERFNEIHPLVINGLKNVGFNQQAKNLYSIKTELEFNQEIIKQYTEETSLYKVVNTLLRNGHQGDDIGNHDLVPWILQLNAAIRNLPEVPGSVFRGTYMNDSDLKMYKVGEVFVWSSFSSFSKNEETCFGGNVIFEMKGVSGIAERDKRAPRDISPYSIFPDENEVLMPICGAYRIYEVKEERGITKIIGHILDHW